MTKRKFEKLAEERGFWSVDGMSISKTGEITVRRGFFYRLGMSAEKFRDSVVEKFPEARILDFGEKYRPFRGGASVKASSHFFVTFTMPEAK